MDGNSPLITIFPDLHFVTFDRELVSTFACFSRKLRTYKIAHQENSFFMGQVKSFSNDFPLAARIFCLHTLSDRIYKENFQYHWGTLNTGASL